MLKRSKSPRRRSRSPLKSKEGKAKGEIGGIKSQIRRFIKESDLKIKAGTETLREIPELIQDKLSLTISQALSFMESAKRKTLHGIDVDKAVGRVIPSVNLILGRQTFRRYIKEITDQFNPKLRLSDEAYDALQTYYESMVSGIVKSVTEYTLLNDKKIITPKILNSVILLKDSLCSF